MRFIASLFLMALAALPTAVLSAPTWTPLSYTNTIIGGVSTLSNGTTFLVAEDSNANKYVERSDDGGMNWQSLNIESKAAFLFDIVMTTTTTGATSGISILAPADSYTIDGMNFVYSEDEKKITMETVQSQQQVAGTENSIGLTGGFSATVMGAAISNDGGQSYNVTSVPFISQARYGAFPSSDVWMLAGGTWPSNSENIIENGHVRLSEKIKMPTSYKGKIRRPHNTQVSTPPAGYYTEIWRTLDGGKTFANVYTTTNYYPNDIRCVSTSTCFFVAENTNNAFIVGTTDGGNTWTQLFEDATAGASLIAAWASSPTDWYAGGGNQNTGEGHIWYSSDAGNTWSKQLLKGGVYVMAMSLANTTYGFAASLNSEGLSGMYLYN